MGRETLDVYRHAVYAGEQVDRDTDPDPDPDPDTDFDLEKEQ